jgi:hypothetical protein
MRMKGHAASMEDIKNKHIILVGKHEVKGSFGGHKSRREDNIQKDLYKEDSEGVDWIQLAQDRDQ